MCLKTVYHRSCYKCESGGVFFVKIFYFYTYTKKTHAHLPRQACPTKKLN